MKNIYVFLIVYMFSHGAVGQPFTLDTTTSIEKSRGYFQSSTILVIKNIAPSTDKLFVGETVETNFLLKNKHMGLGALFIVYDLADKNEVIVDKNHNANCFFITYRPSLQHDLVISGGIGINVEKSICYSGSLRYNTHSFFSRSNMILEGHLLVLPQYINYTIYAYLLKENFIYGACIDNKKISGLTFGVFRDWLMFRCVVSAKKVERSFLFSSAFQVNLTFPF